MLFSPDPVRPLFGAYLPFGSEILWVPERPVMAEAV
jgi:hypothetical protein